MPAPPASPPPSKDATRITHTKDPFVVINTVKCEKCGEVLGYVNSRTSTRTLKMVCSPTCAASIYKQTGTVSAPIKVMGEADGDGRVAA